MSLTGHDEEKSSVFNALAYAQNNQVSGNLNIFAGNQNPYITQPTLPQDYQVPNLDHLHSLAQTFPNKVPYFVGRVEELEDIAKYLQQTSIGVITQAVVSSLGGMGKTSLAIEYYHQYRDSYSLCYWLNCDSLASDWQRLGRQLGVHCPDDMLESSNVQLVYQDLVKQALIKCQQQHQKPILLVFDNVDNAQKLETYQIKGEGFHHLITSRDQSLWTSIIPLQVLDSENMPDYWSQALPERQDELLDLLKLSGVLDYYPLALTYAMGYLKANSHERVATLVANTERRIKKIEKPYKSAWTPHIGVEATLQQIVETLEQQSASGKMAIQLLKLLSLVAAEGVPQVFLQDWMIHWAKENPELFVGLDLSESEIKWTFEDGLNQLKRYQLVNLEYTKILEDTRVKGHRFLHDYILRQSFNEHIKDQCLHVGLAQLGARIVNFDITTDVYNQKHYQPWMDQVAALLNQMSQEALSTAIEDLELDIPLLRAAVYFSSVDTRYDEAERIYKALLAGYKRMVLSADHPGILTLQAHLAFVYLEKNSLDNAERILKNLLAAYQRIGQSSDHPNTLEVQFYFATLYSLQNKLDDAERILKKVLEAYRRIGQSADHPETLKKKQNLAFVYFKQNKLDDAERLLKKVLEAYRRIGQSADHPETLKKKQDLAFVYFKQNKLDDAERILKKVLEAYGRIGQSADHRYILAAHLNLASIYFIQGKWDHVEKLYKHMLSFYEQINQSPDHPDTLSVQRYLARIYLEQNKLDDVERVYKDLLAAYGRIGQSEDHPNTLLAQQDLASLYEKQNKLDDAERVYKDLLAAYGRIGQSADHPETLKTKQNLAFVYFKQNKLDDAMRILKDLLSIY